MARQMRKKDPIVEDSKKKVDEQVSKKTEVVEEVVKKEPVRKTAAKTATREKKVVKIGDTDKILCKSIPYGKVFMEGDKSKDLYEFQFPGDEVYVEYRDIVAKVRSNSKFIFSPIIVVQDEDCIESLPKLKEFYDSIYYMDDPEKILDLEVGELEEILPQIPVGIANALKTIASKRISDNTMDSVAKIRVLDNFFGTQLMLLTGLYD